MRTIKRMKLVQSLLCLVAIGAYLFGHQLVGQTGLDILRHTLTGEENNGMMEILKTLALISGCTLVLATNLITLAIDGKGIDLLRGLFSFYAMWTLLHFLFMLIVAEPQQGLANSLGGGFFLAQTAVLCVFLLSMQIIKIKKTGRA